MITPNNEYKSKFGESATPKESAAKQHEEVIHVKVVEDLLKLDIAMMRESYKSQFQAIMSY